MKRGDIVSVADRAGGMSGKPRPALVVQNDLFNEHHDSVVVCLITADCIGQGLFRLAVPADERTGLRDASEIAVDKVQAVWARRIGRHIGTIGDDLMQHVDQALRRWLAL